MADDRRQQLADEIRGQHARTNSMGHLTRESADFLADALLPLFEQVAADAAAEALSAAADDWIKPNSPSLPVRTWLRARAADLRAPARTDEEN